MAPRCLEMATSRQLGPTWAQLGPTWPHLGLILAPKRPPRGLQEAPRRPREEEAPRGQKDAPKRPKRGPNRPQNSPPEVSKLFQKGPRDASHDIPTNFQEVFNPQPRNGGGMGRRHQEATHIDFQCCFSTIFVFSLFRGSSCLRQPKSPPTGFQETPGAPERPHKHPPEASRGPQERL